mgnify:CR=1 FL=1
MKKILEHHNNKRSEYERKYKLMMYREEYDSWQIKATDDSLHFLKNLQKRMRNIGKTRVSRRVTISESYEEYLKR